VFLACFIVIMSYPTKAKSEGRWWSGWVSTPKEVICRLAKRKVTRGKKICLYIGPNKTQESIFIDSFLYCPQQITCLYEPNPKLPPLDQVLQSIEDAMK